MVVVGSGAVGLAAATAAARRGGRVLFVLGPRARVDPATIRRRLRTAGAPTRRVTVMARSEVVCVDGVGRVEAVVVRRVGSPRLLAFNTTSCVASIASSRRYSTARSPR